MGFFTLLAFTPFPLDMTAHQGGLIFFGWGVLVAGVVVAGAFLGVNNTVITEAVMGAAPVERPVASAAYSFVRFSGGAVAPWAAGRLGEDVSVHAPFWMGALTVADAG